MRFPLSDLCPGMCLHDVLVNRLAVPVHGGQGHGCTGVAGAGRGREPVDRLSDIPRYPGAFQVQTGQIGLGVDMPLHRGRFCPSESLLIILINALSGKEQNGQIVLRQVQALPGGQTELAKGSVKVAGKSRVYAILIIRSGWHCGEWQTDPCQQGDPVGRSGAAA